MLQEAREDMKDTDVVHLGSRGSGYPTLTSIFEQAKAATG